MAMATWLEKENHQDLMFFGLEGGPIELSYVAISYGNGSFISVRDLEDTGAYLDEATLVIVHEDDDWDY